MVIGRTQGQSPFETMDGVRRSTAIHVGPAIAILINLILNLLDGF
jgi:hypothetical protein